MNETEVVNCILVLALYGDADSWRASHGRTLFHSDQALRWHLMTDQNQAELIESGLIFMRGRRLMTADPDRLAAAIVDQMKAMTKKRASRQIAA